MTKLRRFFLKYNNDLILTMKWADIPTLPSGKFYKYSHFFIAVAFYLDVGTRPHETLYYYTEQTA
ncbi:MAG: hypothetical protein F8N35_01220 [Paludibacter sp.]|nr:hypothetical protein [Paludibacter sp.]